MFLDLLDYCITNLWLCGHMRGFFLYTFVMMSTKDVCVYSFLYFILLAVLHSWRALLLFCKQINNFLIRLTLACIWIFFKMAKCLPFLKCFERVRVAPAVLAVVMIMICIRRHSPFLCRMQTLQFWVGIFANGFK